MQKHLWHEGWPLTTTSGAVVLHLGALDESLVRCQDLYLCVKSVDDHSTQLCAIWRSPIDLSIVYHTIDPDKDSLTPIALEMLAEDLPQLLQNLLVGVEHAITRVPLDVLTFPNRDDDTDDASGKRLILSPGGSPKCALKRRDIITKNKSGNGRYAMRRMSNKIETEHKNGKANIAETLSTTSNAEAEPCMMPLFCLGGSFPHIDSDEESGDDLIKTSKDGK